MHKSLNNYMKPYVLIYSIKYCVYIYMCVCVIGGIITSEEVDSGTVNKDTLQPGKQPLGRLKFPWNYPFSERNPSIRTGC